MSTKSAQTRQFILEKTAPIFNQQGYSATSLSVITAATGLTKGAVYGNFKNKESLALEAFNYNVQFIIDQVRLILREIDSPLAKLYALIRFYRGYFDQCSLKGGCPLMNIAVDTKHTNPELFKQVSTVITSIIESIAKVIEDGIKRGEIKKTVAPKLIGSRIFSTIEGAVFTAMMLEDEAYLTDMMNHLDRFIQTEIAC